MKMKKLFESAGVFFGVLKSCMQKAARDTDTHYYLPKSRFRGSDPQDAGLPVKAECGNSGQIGSFFHNLKGCLSTAWRESDDKYHIPKTRFKGGMEDGRIYRSAPVPGTLASRSSESMGSGVWSVRSEDQGTDSKSGKMAEIDDVAYAASSMRDIDPPRLTEE